MVVAPVAVQQQGQEVYLRAAAAGWHVRVGLQGGWKRRPAAKTAVAGHFKLRKHSGLELSVHCTARQAGGQDRAQVPRTA